MRTPKQVEAYHQRKRYWERVRYRISNIILAPVNWLLTAITNPIGCVFSVIACIAAWITHVVYCISAANYILLLFGALCFPIGIIHGVMIWFGHGL